jgi:hypothetical protein
MDAKSLTTIDLKTEALTNEKSYYKVDKSEQDSSLNNT